MGTPLTRGFAPQPAGTTRRLPAHPCLGSVHSEPGWTENHFLNRLPRGSTGDDLVGDAAILIAGEQAKYILERLADLSRPFGTNVELNGDIAEIRLKGRN
jgi:hypothetical protein